MKLWFHLVLAVVAVAGFVHGGSGVVADPVTWTSEVGPHSAATTDPIFKEGGCAGIAAHFAANPIPLNAIDLETGDEIIGWEVYCPDVVVASQGSMGGTGPVRMIPRNFGFIRMKYAP
jgi:hypothetical protein